MGPARGSIAARCLRWLIWATDAILRRIQGVAEFESEDRGVFRIEIGYAECEVLLADGTRVFPGDAVIELHLWNRHLVPVPAGGFGFKCAVRFRRQTLATLHRLARHIQQDPRLAGVRAIRMKPAIANRKPAHALARLLRKIGFEPVADPPRGYLFRFLENIWLWLLTWAFNPYALRHRPFDQKRCAFWISRPRFLALYEDGFVFPPKPVQVTQLQGAGAAKKAAAAGAYRAPR